MTAIPPELQRAIVRNLENESLRERQQREQTECEMAMLIQANNPGMTRTQALREAIQQLNSRRPLP